MLHEPLLSQGGKRSTFPSLPANPPCRLGLAKLRLDTLIRAAVSGLPPPSPLSLTSPTLVSSGKPMSPRELKQNTVTLTCMDWHHFHSCELATRLDGDPLASLCAQPHTIDPPSSNASTQPASSQRLGHSPKKATLQLLLSCKSNSVSQARPAVQNKHLDRRIS